MKLKIECYYCGYIFLKTVYTYYRTVEDLDLRCERLGCGDKNVRIVQDEKRDIFGYNYKEKKGSKGA